MLRAMNSERGLRHHVSIIIFGQKSRHAERPSNVLGKFNKCSLLFTFLKQLYKKIERKQLNISPSSNIIPVCGIISL